MIRVLSLTLIALFIQIGKVDLIGELFLDDFKVGNSLDVFLLHAGEPDYSSVVFHEIYGEQIAVLTYSDSELSFLGGKMIDFYLKDSTFKLMPYDITVGTHSDQLKEVFALSYKNREGDEVDYRMWIALHDTSIMFEVKNSYVVEIVSNSST